MIPEILINDYNYNLPDERIAKYPLPKRDSSKLLIYKEGEIKDEIFSGLPKYLPENALMVFNDTKVVPARLHFCRETGAYIEIFCLEPNYPAEYASIFASDSRCRWKCLVGNVKRWKSDLLSIYNPENDPVLAKMDLKAELVERCGETSIVEFTWKDGSPFSAVLEACGNIPIPPYLNRETENIDKERYQTLYAKFRGSVAAPTAGLHFTSEVLENIKASGIDMEEVCLHVGAGTFLPVKSSEISGHKMHREPFSVSLDLIRKLAADDRPVIAVGTTSVRTLESLYYAGVKCLMEGGPSDIGQWMPYEGLPNYSTSEALGALVSYLEANNATSLCLGTEIIIVPGYKFKVVDVLVTNFHQPQSTLLLLISAFLDGDWKRVYEHALDGGYRFLSYGDSSLLFRRSPEE